MSDIEEKIATREVITKKALEALDEMRDRVAALTIINAVALAKLESAGALDLDNLREAAASNLVSLGEDARRLDQVSMHIEEIIGKAHQSAKLTVIKGGKQDEG